MLQSKKKNYFDCENCDDRLSEIRNCNNFKKIPNPSYYSFEDKTSLGQHNKVCILGTLQLYECPISYIDDEYYLLVDLLEITERTNIFLNGGGLSNQPIWYIEAFKVFLNELNLENSKNKSNE